MKIFIVFCAVLVLEGVMAGKIVKREENASPKTKVDEDVYGILDENDGELQKDQMDYYVDHEDEDAPADTGGNNQVDIKLISKPETFEKEIGEVVRLPCQASKDGVVRVWSKESVMIYQDNIKIGKKNNYERLPNGTLEVVLESEEDFGTYSCKLALSQTIQPEVEHKVFQKSSPVITALFTENNKTLFDIGEDLTITCRADGHPKPSISWHKVNERLSTGGEALTIENVQAKHAGNYRCLADNGVGRPAHAYIEVFVNHAPMVSVDKYIVNSDHESDAELVCEVKAYPTPVVNWQKNGQNIVSKEPKIKLRRENNNGRNILIIKNINEKDFGVYTCVASNALGKDAQNISLIKTPVIRKFENISNDGAKEVILQWRVESKQPISMHELQYRKKGQTSWKTISPEVTNGENDVYLIKHTLKNLEPGIYETRARSKNNHGWSEYSDIVPFQGVPAKHGTHHPKVKHNKKEQKDHKTPDSPHDNPASQRSEEVMQEVADPSSDTPAQQRSEEIAQEAGDPSSDTPAQQRSEEIAQEAGDPSSDTPAQQRSEEIAQEAGDPSSDTPAQQKSEEIAREAGGSTLGGSSASISSSVALIIVAFLASCIRQ